MANQWWPIDDSAISWTSTWSSQKINNNFIHTTWDETVHWNKTFTWYIIWDWSKLTNIYAEVNSASLNIMLWEDWTAWLAYSKVNYEQLTWTTANDLWTTSQPYVAQSFYWQTDITSISLMVATVSSPSDDILIEIQWDNSWVPDWTAIWTSDVVNYSALTSTLTETAFTFATPVTVTEWTLYHIVVKRSWANDDVNYYSVWSAWADTQIWTMSTSDGSTWTNQTDDLYFKLTWYYLATKGWMNFIWILQVDKTTWGIWKFNTQYDNHQSWLTAWNYYWYNQTTWAIESWNMFYAISDTELDLTQKYNLRNLYIWENTTFNINEKLEFNNLTIVNWVTVTFTWWTDYNDSLFAQIKVYWTFDLKWTIDISWAYYSTSWVWAGWNGWNWWIGWNWWWAGWAWWTWSQLWFGWWWGWWNWWDFQWQVWWAGWAGWYPWWVWGIHSSTWWTSSWWWWGNWLSWSWWIGWNWWDAYSNIWNNWLNWSKNNWWGWWWGWAGWAAWKHWWNIKIYATNITDLNILSNWWNGWNWWAGWAGWYWYNWSWWWGWAGWAGWGWAGWNVEVYYVNSVWADNIQVNWWTWWTIWGWNGWNWWTIWWWGWAGWTWANAWWTWQTWTKTITQISSF